MVTGWEWQRKAKHLPNLPEHRAPGWAQARSLTCKAQSHEWSRAHILFARFSPLFLERKRWRTADPHWLTSPSTPTHSSLGCLVKTEPYLPVLTQQEPQTPGDSDAPPSASASWLPGTSPDGPALCGVLPPLGNCNKLSLQWSSSPDLVSSQYLEIIKPTWYIENRSGHPPHYQVARAAGEVSCEGSVTQGAGQVRFRLTSANL